MNTTRFSLGVAALCLAPVCRSPASSVLARAHARTRSTSTPAIRSATTIRQPGYVPAYYPVGVGPYWGWPSVYGYNATTNIPFRNIRRSASITSNATSVVMKDIEFGLVVRGTLVAEVRDVGTFSPGAEIKHEFGLSPNVFPLQTSFAEVRSAEDHVRRRNEVEESAPAGAAALDLRTSAALNDRADASRAERLDLPEPAHARGAEFPSGRYR